MPAPLVLWVHLLAAVALIGGFIVMRVIVKPVLEDRPEPQHSELMRQIGRRFRTLTWISVVALVLTGSFNLLNAGAAERIETDWGVVLMIKLLGFAILVGFLIVHDFIVDPYRDRPPSRSLGRPPREPRSTTVGFLHHAILATSLAVLLLASYLASL